MVELFDKDIVTSERRSSKGNQLKWGKGGKWYKADYTGYEGLSEYIVSHILMQSNLSKSEYIVYDIEQISYKHTKYNGCVSDDFLQDGWQLITLERLFHNAYGESLTKSIYKITDTKSRLEFIVNQIERITGLHDFGIYMSKLMSIDALFLNEDRHMHNIAVLVNEKGQYEYCPIFDNGASLLSDITMDYPLNADLNELLKTVKPKSFARSFDEQLEIAEKLYGQSLKFELDRGFVQEALKKDIFYDEIIKERVHQLIMWQMRKYNYLFG